MIEELVITKETDKFIRDIRKTLKSKGYNKTISRCNRKIGTMHFNYIYEYYTRPKTNIMFEFEKDLENNTINAKMHHKDKNNRLELIPIRLADIKDLC